MLYRKPFFFLRHGQTDWNAKGLLQGRTDVPLNGTGERQADEAKAYLVNTPITTICCSPLGRARQTADIVNKSLKCQLVIIDELQECSFGEAEGKPIFGDSYDVLIRSAGNYGGESIEAFVERVIGGINQALTHPGPVLIVSHGGVFRALQSHVRFDHKGDMPNCVPMHLRPSGGEGSGWKMELALGAATTNRSL